MMTCKQYFVDDHIREPAITILSACNLEDAQSEAIQTAAWRRMNPQN
jgi:hypothetical protein